MYLLLLCPTLVAAQGALDEVNRIKADQQYIWGEGYGETVEAADKAAMAQLSSNISVNVESEFVIDEQEVNTSAGNDAKSRVESVVRTYTMGSLNNTRSIVVHREPQAYVVRYIERKEVDRVFQEREERIMSYVYSARNAEKEGRIDDALRNYYWGFSLLKSLQHPNSVKITDQGVKFPLMVWVPEQVNSILGKLKAEIAKVEENVVDLFITYKDEPVTSVDFRYMDGQNFSNINSAKDGLAQVEMRPGAPTDKIQLKYEYEFAGQMRQDRELEMVANVFKGTPFAKATVMVVGGKKAEQKKVQAVYQAAVMNMSVATHSVQVATPKTYVQTLDRVVTAIKHKNYLAVKDYFTPEGYKMFEALINYGSATVLGNPEYRCYELNGRTVCRSVPMRFSFKNNNRSFIEDVTFTFNKEQKIESLAFGLDKAARDDIFNREAPAWNDSVRMVIATFLENYKTAFALKRLDYIQSIFDDDAIIIVGHVTKHANKGKETTKYIDNELVKYTRQDKQSYLRNLEKSFKSNQFINIRFADNEVKKMGKGGETYGIQIHQDYYSSSYGDTGYLFLMVDMNDADQPVIKVRTWQPNRDPNINGNFAKDDRYYGLIYGGNFD